MTRFKQGVFSWEDVIAQRYQSNKPAALPRARKSSALPGRNQIARQPDMRLEWSSQLDSSLLTKLCPEIRVIIWEMVLGGMRLHIIQRPNRRMSHVVCPLVESCEICQGNLPQAVRDGNSRSKARLLALTLTCKQIYCESIQLLYSLNIFEFSNTWSLTYLRPTIPVEFWDAIREVELRWAFPGHWLPSKDPVKTVYFSAGRQQWIETCYALTNMKGLQSFTLQLMGNWFCEPAEKIPVFLEPLRELHLKDRWKLQLPRQPYYIKEIRTIHGDLGRKGIDCSVRAV